MKYDLDVIGGPEHRWRLFGFEQSGEVSETRIFKGPCFPTCEEALRAGVAYAMAHGLEILESKKEEGVEP